MQSGNKALGMAFLVVEALFLAFILYTLGDAAFLAVRMLHRLPYTLVTTAIALIAPGVLLVRGYLGYAKGDPSSKNRILAAAAIAATVFGLTLIPGINSLIFGLGQFPTNHSLRLRLFELTFGRNSMLYFHAIGLVVQAILPVLMLALCERKSFAKDTLPIVGKGLLSVVGTILVIWAASAAINGLVASHTFDHSWLIIGFVPIPGQVMLAFPIIVALAIIVVLWTRPWK